MTGGYLISARWFQSRQKDFPFNFTIDCNILKYSNQNWWKTTVFQGITHFGTPVLVTLVISMLTCNFGLSCDPCLDEKIVVCYAFKEQHSLYELKKNPLTWLRKPLPWSSLWVISTCPKPCPKQIGRTPPPTPPPHPPTCKFSTFYREYLEVFDDCLIEWTVSQPKYGTHFRPVIHIKPNPCWKSDYLA